MCDGRLSAETNFGGHNLIRLWELGWAHNNPSRNFVETMSNRCKFNQKFALHNGRQ